MLVCNLIMMVRTIAAYEHCMVKATITRKLDELIALMVAQKRRITKRASSKFSGSWELVILNRKFRNFRADNLNVWRWPLLLISEPELLILDEPTNHLDLEMVEWLEEFLRRSSMALLMVTHDRYFLDRVCNCDSRN